GKRSSGTSRQIRFPSVAETSTRVRSNPGVRPASFSLQCEMAAAGFKDRVKRHRLGRRGYFELPLNPEMHRPRSLISRDESDSNGFQPWLEKDNLFFDRLAKTLLIVRVFDTG